MTRHKETVQRPRFLIPIEIKERGVARSKESSIEGTMCSEIKDLNKRTKIKIEHRIAATANIQKGPLMSNFAGTVTNECKCAGTP